MKHLRKALWGFTATLALGVSAGAAEQAARVVTLNIASQPLADALSEVAKQAGLQIVFLSELGKGMTAGPLTGRFTPEQALERLLLNTGLEYSYLKEDTVAIRSAKSISRAQTGQVELRVAQAEGNVAATQEEAPATTDWGSDSGVLEEIVVTGTHIRGVRSSVSPLKTYTRDDIEQSGAANLEQFARKMPENFSSVDAISNLSNSNVARGFNGFAAGANLFNGAAFDLYGLGSGSTLTLVDGRRLSPGGQGDFIDVSLIPMAAIERVEVLTDGASAIYGSDAVSGVVNIITRTDYSGAQSRLQYGGSTEGGAASFSASQLAGVHWTNGNAFFAYDYTWNEGLDASERDYIPATDERDMIIPRDRRHAVLAQFRQSLAGNTVASGTLHYGKRNFFQQDRSESPFFDATVFHDGDAEQKGAALAIDHSFSNDWHLKGSAGYSRMEQTDSTLQITTFGTGDSRSDLDSQTLSLDAMADGAILSLPGGALKGAIGANYRSEKYQEAGLNNSVPVNPLLGRRSVRSAFAEIFVPLVGDANAVRAIERLEVSAAVRYDDYSDFGSDINPKVGLLWSPIPGWSLRGSYSTSFRAPLLKQKASSTSALAFDFFNPNSPTLSTDAIQLFGGNEDLKAEEAKNWTAGITVQPPGIPSLTIALDYFHIVYRDRVRDPPTVGDFFSDVAVAPFVTFDPPLSVVEDIFSGSLNGQPVNFLNDFSFDPNTGQPRGAQGVEAIFDARFANMARTEEAGITFAPRYEIATAAGDIALSATVIRLLDNKLQTTPAATELSLLNTFATPTKWKGNTTVAWNRGAFGAALTARYASKYRNSLLAPSQPIDSWLTGDMYLSYRTTDSTNEWFRDLTVALSVNNITDEEPPLVQVPSQTPGGTSVIPFDSTNASPIGRFISLSVAKGW